MTLKQKTFLTDEYRRRYLSSLLSSVDYSKLLGKEVEIGKKHLYNIPRIQMVYPYSPVGSSHIDVVQTVRANVTMRYSEALENIEVSFDGKFFHTLPSIENILGNPFLSKDGMWVIAFYYQRCR